MADELSSTDSRIATTPARMEVDRHFETQGGKLGLELYRLLLTDKFPKDGSVNRSFEQLPLYSDQGIDFAKRIGRLVGPQIKGLFDCSFEKKDEETMEASITSKYKPNDPLFTLTAAEVLVATLESMNQDLASSVIEHARTAVPGVNINDSNDELSRQQWASFFQGMALGTQKQLVDGPDAKSEKARVAVLSQTIDEMKTKGEDVSAGENFVEKIKAGLSERKSAGEALFQFSGRVWSGQKKS